MKKVIKIFLGSSIKEFEREREAIDLFIRRISDSFEDNYGVRIRPLLCENFDEAYSEIRKQEEYNEKVRESDLCFFIFFTKAGQYTREEFGVARQRFLETGKPKIYTYFKVLGDETAEESLTEFMDELDKVFTHYYGTFEHIDTVKLRILLNLKLQELDFVEIKTEGDYCTVDGVKALPLENISEFANNQIFKELKAELQETEERYFALKARYVSDDCTEGEAREYAEIATKRSNLLEAIEELRKSIFNMSLRMCKDEIRGEITPRQKEAYRLFEAGDIEGANRILDFSEIKSEYERKKAIRKAEQQKETQIFIRETKTKIDMLGMLTKIADRFNEMEELYDEITAEAFDIGVEADAVIDFVWFLYEQNKHQKAYDTAVMLKEVFVDEGKITDSDEIAKVYLCLGTVCSDMSSKKDEAEEYLIKAIAIREELAGQNPERFNSDLAGSLNNAGIFYKKHGQTEKAEKYYKKAIEIYEELARQNPERFNHSLATSYNNAGAFYADQIQTEKAEKYYLKAIVIREELARQNPERFNPYLAGSLNNAGAFYAEQGQTEKAEEYYIKAVEIYEDLARQNPERFKPDLATSYYNGGVFYKEQGQAEKAEEYYKKAIAIREELARQNPQRFISDLAISYNNAGNFYYEQGQTGKAAECYKKAIDIYEELARQNPERFNPELAGTYFNFAIFMDDVSYFVKAFELARTAPEHPMCRQMIEQISKFLT